MRLRVWVALLVAMLAAGCGGADDGPTAEERARASESAEAEASASAAAERKARQRAAAQRRYEDCADGTRGLLNAMQEIDSRLSIGMAYAEYSERVGDAQVAYDRLFSGPDLDPQCLLKVGIALEVALNKYIGVYNVWGDCIDDYACDFSVGEPNRKAQEGWAAASRAISKAERGQESLAP